MINSAHITGNLTDDAQLKALPTGTSVLEFSVAVNERRKRGDDWEDYRPRPVFLGFPLGSAGK